MNTPLAISREGNIAILHMDDRRNNTLTTRMLVALTEAMAEVAQADAILLKGKRRIFCSGIDLEEVVPMSAAALMDYLEWVHRAFRALLAVERPLVVAGAGSAIAGGAVLLCCGDLRIGARDAGVVGFNEVKLGVGFPAAPAEAVRAALNPAQAARAMLFGELVNKEEAAQRGFFHRMVEAAELEQVTLEQARMVSKLPGAAYALAKRELRREALERIDARWQVTNESFAGLWASGPTRALLQTLLESLR